MTKSRTSNRSGFTIIELLVYMVIATVAIVTITGFMVDVIKYAAGTKAKKEVQQNSRLVMSRISQDIRNAQAIDDAANTNCPPLRTACLTLKNSQGIVADYSFYNNRVEYWEYKGTPLPPLVWQLISTISNDKVRVTQPFSVAQPLPFGIPVFQNQSPTNFSEVTITIRLEQKSPSAPVSQAYSEQLSTTIVRRQSLY